MADKVILVTGAGRGMGLEVVRKHSELGDKGIKGSKRKAFK